MPKLNKNKLITNDWSEKNNNITKQQEAVEWPIAIQKIERKKKKL